MLQKQDEIINQIENALENPNYRLITMLDMYGGVKLEDLLSLDIFSQNPPHLESVIKKIQRSTNLSNRFNMQPFPRIQPKFPIFPYIIEAETTKSSQDVFKLIYSLIGHNNFRITLCGDLKDTYLIFFSNITDSLCFQRVFDYIQINDFKSRIFVQKDPNIFNKIMNYNDNKPNYYNSTTYNNSTYNNSNYNNPNYYSPSVSYNKKHTSNTNNSYYKSQSNNYKKQNRYNQNDYNQSRYSSNNSNNQKKNSSNEYTTTNQNRATFNNINNRNGYSSNNNNNYYYNRQQDNDNYRSGYNNNFKQRYVYNQQ
ncbi:hypothetical protein M9Y10_043496 [Tritrichomonas musculus]|uniref:Uncharacterized protein n=1 Tax=Tritrichomonas musculus TaxID=1915356 RepID=A0ABR2K076_9EUKA